MGKYRAEGDFQSIMDLSDEAFAQALQELEKKRPDES